MSAFLLPVFCGIAALAIDMGRLYLERRELQGVNDLAAITAAAQLGSARQAAQSIVDVNSIEASLSLVKGRYTADIKTAPSQRFVSGQQPYNAVQVDLAREGRSYFSTARFLISTSALGVVDPRVAFSLGSRLAAVRDGIPNAILGALLGGNVTMSAASYDALLSGEVKLVELMNSLATRANITAGTYNDVLSAEMTLGQLLAAMAEAASSNGQTSAAAALTLLVTSAGASRTLQAGDVIDLGPAGRVAIGDSSPGLESEIEILGLLASAADVANGARQISLDLGATVPGLSNVSVTLAVGEPLQNSGYVAVGEPGAELQTAQIRLRLVAEIGGQGLIAGHIVRLPLAIDIANATARLEDATYGQDAKAKIGVVTGVAKAWIGEAHGHMTPPVSMSVTPANIITTSVARVTATSHVSVGSASQTLLEFDQSDVDAGNTKTVGSNQLVGSLASSLLRNATINIEALGLPLASPSELQGAVARTLAEAAAPLDDVVSSILETLGVHFGEADVQVHRIGCTGAVLGG